MSDRFPNPRAAKEYLIERIVAQAKRDGVELSEIECKMLYFTETGWTLPDMERVNEKFDEECDQDQYEAKIAGLVSRVHETAEEADEEKWNDAVEVLGSEDHYLLVLVAPYAGRDQQASREGLAKPILIGALIAAAAGFRFWIYTRFR